MSMNKLAMLLCYNSYKLHYMLKNMWTSDHPYVELPQTVATKVKAHNCLDISLHWY